MAFGHCGVAGMDLRWFGHASLHAGSDAVRGPSHWRRQHDGFESALVQFDYPRRLLVGLGFGRGFFRTHWRSVGPLASIVLNCADLCRVYGVIIFCADVVAFADLSISRRVGDRR